MKAMMFGTDNPGATGRGRYYWLIGLADGRELSVHAEYLRTTAAGAVEAVCIRGWSLDKPEGDGIEQVLLSIAPGAWAHWYGASLLDGSPVIVEKIYPPHQGGTGNGQGT